MQRTFNLFFCLCSLCVCVCVCVCVCARIYFYFPCSPLIFRETCIVSGRGRASRKQCELCTFNPPASCCSVLTVNDVSGIIFFLSGQIPGWKSTIWPLGNRSYPLFYFTYITKWQPQVAGMGSAQSLPGETASAKIHVPSIQSWLLVMYFCFVVLGLCL